MLRLIHTRRGKKGVLRVYQHATLGVVEIVTMHGKKGSADVVHIQDVATKVRRQRFDRHDRKQAQG